MRSHLLPSSRTLTEGADGALGSAFLVLVLVVPYLPARGQRFQVYFWSTFIALMYSILIVLYKTKNRGTTSLPLSPRSDSSSCRIPFQAPFVAFVCTEFKEIVHYFERQNKIAIFNAENTKLENWSLGRRR